MHKTAGFFLFASSAIIFLGITTAEILYPNYNISRFMISILGSLNPETHSLTQPSASIFDTSMKIAGLLLMLGAYFLFQTKEYKRVAILLFLSGLGILIIGFVPAYLGLPHNLAALLAFATGGISAILTTTKTVSPLKYIVFTLGTISLTFLLLGIFIPQSIVPYLGLGGTERWVAYPIVLYLTVFGGYLLAKDK